MVLQFHLAVSAVAALVDYVITTLERLINWFRNSRLGHVVEALKIMGQYIEHAKVHGMLSATRKFTTLPYLTTFIPLILSIFVRSDSHGNSLF